MRQAALLAMIMIITMIGACGGKSRMNEPGGAETFGGGSPSAGAPLTGRIPPSMCADDWDCEGHPCVEIYPGHRKCIVSQSEASQCHSELDDCCSATDIATCNGIYSWCVEDGGSLSDCAGTANAAYQDFMNTGRGKPRP
jgi:hypothetical protein